MSVNFKKIIKREIEPVVLEKGFVVDEYTSKYAMGYVYFKYYGKKVIDDTLTIDLKEEILIHRSRWYPEIKAQLRSGLNKDNVTDLGLIAGLEKKFWWSVRTEEEAEASIKEIKQLMGKYAWDWFAKRDAEDITTEVKE